MMRGPPENTLLRRGHGHPGDDELKPAAGLERAVGEIAVISGRDEEHAHFIKKEAREQVGPLERHKEESHSPDMNKHKRDTRKDL